MKQEKETIWLIKLYQSNYYVGFFKTNCACIKDFEIVCDAPTNDKNFRNWIKEMKELGVIEFFERKNNGGFGRTVDYFVVNKSLILKRLRELDTYIKIVKFFNSKEIFGASK